MASIAVQRSLSKKVIGTVLCQRKAICRAYSTESIQDKDVVIVGGGPAGLALASALGSNELVRESIKVALVEAGDLSKIHDWSLPAGTYSNRVSSITNSSRTFLEDIGAWSYVDASRTSPVREMQVWDGISDARITFDAAEIPSSGGTTTAESSEMARLTENLNLQRALLRHLANIEDIQLLQKVKVESIQREHKEGGNGWPLVHLSDGTTIRARLLVGADGFNSPVRSYAGISSYGWAYDTQAVVATLNHPPRGAFQGPNHTAYQRFLPTGPIAFLPLSPTVSSLVWSTKPRLAAALCKSDPAVLANMINAAFRLPEVSVRYLHERILEADIAGTSLSHEAICDEIAFRERSHDISKYSAYASITSAISGGIPPNDAEAVPPLVTSIQPGTIASFPLKYNRAEAYLGEGPGGRTVLVGDAAHTVHPLAGQGLNLGLGDVECLARCITQTLTQGGDIGAYTALRSYSRERYFANYKVMSAVDKLHKLYSTTLGPVVWARSVGLEVLNELDSVKAALMMDAGGSRIQGSGWDVLAKGVEGLAGGLSTASMLGQGIGSVVGARIGELAKTVGRRYSS
ncbi:hypothetical protein HYDPIDRAFT_89241 [Hydnomerulius pinastri MD-312]|uniref:Ubiquinone biosynthesis monooxygenase COQ6, mitochondrial n=1 Tax=Hydnomerulius pinastri MD-312 TaxID=994086 RepID=A0A0C9WAU0_9AGAM|nr:hypothetical protein HYDPIDRAFT_89241 [Hydnomerulius pinastri MD-312]